MAYEESNGNVTDDVSRKQLEMLLATVAIGLITT